MCFIRKGVLINIAKFTGKHLCQCLFFSKVANFIKKKTLTQVFSCEFCEKSKNTLLTEHLRATAFVSIIQHEQYFFSFQAHVSAACLFLCAYQGVRNVGFVENFASHATSCPSLVSHHQVNPCPNPPRREKIKLNFYFHPSLWCLKRFLRSLRPS